MGGTAGPDAWRLQGIPLASRAAHEEEGIHRPAISDAGPMPPQGAWFTRREQRDAALPQHVRDAPAVIRSWAGRVCLVWSGPWGSGTSP
jgi:hypothetical protein